MSVLIHPLGIILELTVKRSHWEVPNQKARSNSSSVCRWLNLICGKPQDFMKWLKSLNESCKLKCTQSKYKNHMYVCIYMFVNSKLFEKEISTERNKILRKKLSYWGKDISEKQLIIIGKLKYFTKWKDQPCLQSGRVKSIEMALHPLCWSADRK